MCESQWSFYAYFYGRRGDTPAFYDTLQELNDTNKCHFRVHMIGVENISNEVGSVKNVLS
jgi:hypothetical protein